MKVVLTLILHFSDIEDIFMVLKRPNTTQEQENIMYLICYTASTCKNQRKWNSSPNDTDILTQLHNMKIILLTSQVLLVGVCASGSSKLFDYSKKYLWMWIKIILDQQGNNFVNTEKCSEQRESLDKVFRVLDGLSDVTQMLSVSSKYEHSTSNSN